jgi:hypothetical protein
MTQTTKDQIDVVDELDELSSLAAALAVGIVGLDYQHPAANGLEHLAWQLKDRISELSEDILPNGVTTEGDKEVRS